MGPILRSWLWGSMGPEPCRAREYLSFPHRGVTRAAPGRPPASSRRERARIRDHPSNRAGVDGTPPAHKLGPADNHPPPSRGLLLSDGLPNRFDAPVSSVFSIAIPRIATG